jgi:hypothetical protein
MLQPTAWPEHSSLHTEREERARHEVSANRDGDRDEGDPAVLDDVDCDQKPRSSWRQVTQGAR